MFRTVTACLVCLALCAPAARAADKLSPAQVATLNSVVRSTMAAQHRPSVVIEINRNGQRIFSRAWGVQNVAASVPANVDTLYQYGSITKQFTAMCILLLAQDGKLSLNERIGKYLPAFSNSAARLDEMLVHVSGLADPSDTLEYLQLITPQLVTGPVWVMSRAARGPALFAHGTKVKYDNTAYTALARIVEAVSGMSFDRFLKTRIFDVIGMRRVHPYRYFTVERNAALGYMWWEPSYKEQFMPDPASQGAADNQLVNAPLWNLRQLDGAGYLVGDAADLQRWDDALLGGTLLHGKWRQLFFSAGKLANGSIASVSGENPTKGNAAYFCYGGLAKISLKGRTMFLANGGTFGFSTFTAIVPDRHISVTMLSNLRSSGNDAITIPLLQLLVK